MLGWRGRGFLNAHHRGVGIQSGSKRNSKRKAEMDLGGIGKQARPTLAPEEDKEGNLYAKTFTVRPPSSEVV